ncbi:MAG: hypothetical protein ABIE36_01730 [Candidatus Diapherotrites archaeon]
MKTNEEMRPNEVSNSEKPKKNRRWMIHVFLAILIAILLLWKCCSGETKKEYQENITSLTQERDSVIKENDSLKLRINELENRKAVLNVTDTVADRSSGKFVEAIIVPLYDSRKSSLFIKDVVKTVKVEVPVPVECPPVPECPELLIAKDSCIMDTLNLNITESGEDYSKVLTDSSFSYPKLFISSDFVKKDFSSEYRSCFDSRKPIQVIHNWTNVKVDYQLIKKAKTKHWIATTGRLASMLGYALLYHSDKQFAITYNGIPPYDKSNPYEPDNSLDKKIAGNKVWAERGIWLLYGGSEVLEYSSTRDFRNAYSYNQMTVTFNLNFGK